MSIWYRVSDLDAARAFYTAKLGFQEAYVDDEDRWARLVRGQAEVALAEGERLRAEGVQVGVVLEIPGTIRLLDVYDPDGNRLQLSQDI